MHYIWRLNEANNDVQKGCSLFSFVGLAPLTVLLLINIYNCFSHYVLFQEAPVTNIALAGLLKMTVYVWFVSLLQASSALAFSRPFLSLFVVRHHTTSSDIILRRVQIEVDNLEVEVDADVLNGLNVRHMLPANHAFLSAQWFTRLHVTEYFLCVS